MMSRVRGTLFIRIFLVALFDVTAADLLRLANDIINVSFDSNGNLLSIQDSRSHQQHNISNDGWSFVVGDLPFPTGATVFKNRQVLVNATCPLFPGPPPMTSVDQCAFACMGTEGCVAWSAHFDDWVTWGRPRLDCRSNPNINPNPNPNSKAKFCWAVPSWISFPTPTHKH